MVPIVKWAVRLCTVVLTVKQCNGQCYLEDISQTCSVCWITDPSGDNRRKHAGMDTCGTQAVRCPQDPDTGSESVEFIWDEAIPEEMIAGEDYSVRYTIKIDSRVFPIVLSHHEDEPWHIPHSNIHSCYVSGADAVSCTPSVKDGKFSTHTAAKVSNVTQHPDDENFVFATFDATVNLEEATYTIIVHNRIFTPDPNVGPDTPCWPNCKEVKVDTAIGVYRKVAMASPGASSDSFIVTGVVGAVILVLMATIFWTSRTGRLDLDAILRAMSSEEVVLIIDLLLEGGDITAFQVSYIQEVIGNPKLANWRPAFMLTLVAGWLVSFAMLYVMVRNGYELYCTKYRPEFTKLKRSASAQKLDRRISLHACHGEDIQHLFLESERAKRAVMSQYTGIASVVFKDCPMCILASVMLILGGDISVVVVLAFWVSSAMLGGKSRAFAGFSVDMHAFRVAREALGKALKSDAVRTSWRSERGLSHSSFSFIQDGSSQIGNGENNKLNSSGSDVAARQPDIISESAAEDTPSGSQPTDAAKHSTEAVRMALTASSVTASSVGQGSRSIPVGKASEEAGIYFVADLLEGSIHTDTL